DLYGTWIDKFKGYPLVNFTPQAVDDSWKPSETRVVEFLVENKGLNNMEISSQEDLLLYILKDGDVIDGYPLQINDRPFLLRSSAEKFISLTITAPDEKGEYKYVISVKTSPFPGTR